MTDPEKIHQEKVAAIYRQVKILYQKGLKIRIYHGSTNSTRAQNFKRDEIVDISNLNQVITINRNEKIAVVEPNIPMDVLVKETLKYGLIPPVIMEFPGITVGGGVQGGAGESSSFRYGIFNNICKEYEIVLGNGDVINVSPEQNADLFYGTACAYGTLGILTSIKLQLIPAKKYAALTYYKVTSYKEAVQIIEAVTKKDADFIDGILYSKETGVILVGKLTDNENLPLATFHKATDDWFFIHAEKMIKQHDKWEERIPLEDYFFRYDRGAFWIGTYPFQKLKIPFNKTSRFFFNPLMHTRTLYRFLQAINISQRFFIQDISLPKENTLKFLEYIDKKIGIFPLWLCPLKPSEKEKLSPTHTKSTLIINVGIWGKLSNDFNQLIALNREIEKLVQKLNGRKILYAHAYYSEEEFWEIYDLDWYRKLRKKYHAETAFPDVYEKTKVKEKYKYSLLKGLIDVIKSPFKLPIS